MTTKQKHKIHHGRNVQFCRELRGVKQPDLANLIGVCTRTMARYESKELLSEEVLLKISNLLNFDIEFMKELKPDSDLKVININEGGKLYTDNSSSNEKTYTENSKDFEPNSKNYEPNAKDESKNTFGVPVENYDKIYDMLIKEKEKNFRLESENKSLKLELEKKQ